MKVRKLAVALALAGGLGSNLTYALGMGEARITSSLNEPLRAEIQLVRPGDVSKDQIRASLASEADFRRAGVERMHFLSNVDMEVKRDDQGQMIIVVTSDRPVREPFLNFLVELTWPSGRLMREYAFLVDPPEYGAPAADAPSAPTAAPERRAEPREAPAPRAEPAPRPTADRPDTYRPTRSNDTLWDIAGDVRPADDLTREQVMLALQDLNPDAFMGNNINRLRRDEVLRLPTADQARQRSRGEASRLVAQQHQAFADMRAAPAPTPEAPPATRPAPTEAAPGDDEMRLIVDDQRTAEDGSPGGVGVGDGDSELALALEERDRAERQQRELAERLEELESQLETMEQLVALKDDELAALQAQLAAAGEEPVVPEEDEDVADVVAAAPDEPEPPAEPEPEPEPEPEAEPAPAAEEPVTEEPVTEAREPFTFRQLMDELRTNWMYQVGAGGIAIAFLALLWALARRNARREQDYLSALGADIGDDDDVLDLGDPGRTDDDSGHAAAASDLESAEVDEIISEADHYVAYGRLDQAAQLLEESISKEPSRSDLRLKLLEVYAESGDQGAFDRQYRELEALDEDDALEEAGRLRERMDGEAGDLSIDDLEEQLKTGSKGAGAFAATSAFAAKEEEEDAGDSEDAGSEDFSLDWDLDEKDKEPEAEQESDDLDFADLDESLADDDKAEPETAKASEEEAESDDFNFTLDEPASDEVKKEAEDVQSEQQDTEDAGDELGDIEFTLDEAFDSDTAGTESDDDTSDELSDDDLASLGLEDDEADDLSLDDLEEPEESKESAEADDSVPYEPAAPAEKAESPEDKPEAADTGSDFDDSFLAELDAELDKVTGDDADDEFGTDEGGELDDLELDVSDEDLALLEEVAGEDDQPEAPAEAADAESGKAEEEPTLDVDLEDDDIPVATDLSDDEAAALEDPLPEDLPENEAGDFDDSILDEASAAMASDETVAADKDDKSGTPALSGMEGDEDYDFLEGTDEAGTKLDLARAYVEMGDAEGARDILEEVAIEGNDEQKAEANKLLGEL